MLKSALAPQADPAPQPKAPPPDILHYLWLVELPLSAPLSPPGYTTFLLSTVYDEDFTAYISKLVQNNPGPFNAAAAVILGFEGIAGNLPQPDALQEFIALIAARDLTQTNPVIDPSGNPSFLPFYPFTAAFIHDRLGGRPPAEPADTAKTGAP